MTVETTFGRWKSRFIRFGKHVDMEVKNIVAAVLAPCILHNICEAQNNNFLSQWQNDDVHEVAMPVDDIQECEVQMDSTSQQYLLNTLRENILSPGYRNKNHSE